jgi:uncharacterized protein (TIGR02118 family)
MSKFVSLLNRKSGVSRSEFQHWWKDLHGPLAAKLPGLQRYVLSFPIDDSAPFDGMAELYFSNFDALLAGLDSPEGIASRADTMAHISGRLAMLMAEHEIPIVGI